MDYLPKELKENQLRLEVFVDPATLYMTMKTHIDDETPPVDLIAAEVTPKDPLLQAEMEQVDFETLSELDQLIYMERQRLLNLKLPTRSAKCCKIPDSSSGSDEHEPNSNHRQLTQKEKSRLRMKKWREKETNEEREYRKFRGRIHTMKARLLQKLRNFDDETYLNELNKRASDRVKQKRLELRANETPAQEALRKQQVNLARRRLFLRNKAFSTPEDKLREKERRLKYLERTWSRHTEEQRTAKRKYATEKAKERRLQNKKEWLAIQKAVKGEKTEKVESSPQLKDDTQSV